jgi:hypothetical protein
MHAPCDWNGRSDQYASAPAARTCAVRASSERTAAKSACMIIAISAVARGSSAHSITSRARAGHGLRSIAGARFAIAASYASNGLNPGSEEESGPQANS